MTKLDPSIPPAKEISTNTRSFEAVSAAPCVSVIMPVYNAASWLASSVGSLQKQTFPDFELIVVDDGSTDDGPELLAQLASMDSRIRVLRKENSGIADSLNKGIAVAKGDWICRLDADDISLPGRIERQLKLARANPTAVLIGSDMMTIDKDGKELRRYNYPNSHKKLLRRLVEGGQFFAHSSVFFRRDAFEAVGGYRSRISKAEDHDLWLRLSEIGSILSVQAPLIRYRLHPSQASYTDGGFRQAVDKTVAVASYHLRVAGEIDPVNLPDVEFQAFRSFVEGHFRARKKDEMITFFAQLREKRAAGGKRSLLATITNACLTNPLLILRLVTTRVCPERTGFIAARAWRLGSSVVINPPTF